MRLSTQQRIEAPIDWVWRRLSDFPPHADALRGRGVRVERLAPGDASGAGMAWRVAGSFRGAEREGEVRVARVEPPASIALEGSSGGMRAASEVALAAEGPALTGLSMWIELRATDLSSKLFLGALSVGRGEFQRRFDARLEGYAASLGAAYAADGAPRRPSPSTG